MALSRFLELDLNIFLAGRHDGEGDFYLNDVVRSATS